MKYPVIWFITTIVKLPKAGESWRSAKVYDDLSDNDFIKFSKSSFNPPLFIFGRIFLYLASEILELFIMLEEIEILKTKEILTVILANLFNLAFAAIFLLRYYEMSRSEYYTGLAVIVMGLPFLIILIINCREGGKWWSWGLLILPVVYCLLELLLDYIFQIDFRSGSLLWLYIPVFYLALFSLIGLSFLISKTSGIFTLFTYFIQLTVFLLTISRHRR